MSLKATVDSWISQGRPVAIAMVTSTFGSSPREAGAIAAVSGEGDIAGSVSAGCVEGAVVAEALDCLEDSQPRMVRFAGADMADATDPAADSSAPTSPHAAPAPDVDLPCAGAIEVLVQPYDDEVHPLLLDALETGDAFAFFAVVDETHPLFGTQGIRTPQGQTASWADPLFLEEALGLLETTRPGAPETRPVMGAPTLLVRRDAAPTIVCVGAVHIAQALTALARIVGYRTVVVDPRGAFAQPERFPDADQVIAQWPQQAFPTLKLGANHAVCALSHDEKIDGPALQLALQTSAFYVGCLGSFKTLGKRRQALLELGVDEADLERVFGPIGINLGGNSPEEIALSVLAQVQAARYSRLAEAGEAFGHTLAFRPAPRPFAVAPHES